MPMVAIYRRGFLPLSETFIVDHIHSLRRYRPFVMADDIIVDIIGMDSNCISSIGRALESGKGSAID